MALGQYPELHNVYVDDFNHHHLLQYYHQYILKPHETVFIFPQQPSHIHMRLSNLYYLNVYLHVYMQLETIKFEINLAIKNVGS